MKKKTLTLMFFCFVWQIGLTQNVGISTGGSTPRDCAMLDILSSTKGLLIPNLALTATGTYAPATGTSVDGLLIYNTAGGVTGTGANGTGYYFWSTAALRWINLLDNYPADYWSLIGNSGSTASSAAIGSAVNNNFIGTTDAAGIDFVLATKNLERMRITAAGNISINSLTMPKGGIGFAKFGIDGTNGSSAGPHVQYTTSSDNYPVFQQLNWSHDNISLNFDSYFDGGWKSATAAATSNFQIYKISNNLNFNYALGAAAGAANSWITAMTILGANGNVGINTTNPVYKLETDGDIYANGGWFRVSGTQGIYWESYGPGLYASDGTWLRTYNNCSFWAGTGQIGTNGSFTGGYGGASGPAGGAIFAGAVGVGTSTPATSTTGGTGVTSFHIVSTSQPAGGYFPVEITNSTNLNAIAGCQQLSTTTGYNSFEGITQGIYGGVFGLHITGSGAGMGVVGKTNSTNSGAYGVWAENGGGASYGLVVSGPTWCSAGSWSGSDRKLKTNIAPMESPLSKLLLLNIYTYDYKPEFVEKYGFNTGKNYGVMADELEKLFPELTKDISLAARQEGKSNTAIKSDPIDIKSVNYTGLVPVLIEAIKDQQKQIEDLKKEVAGLKSKTEK